MTYSLVVQTPSGEKVSAICTIPPEPGAPAVSGVKENDDFRFSITWSNPLIYKYFILILDAVGSYENPYPGGSGKIDLQSSLLEDIKFPSDKQVLNNSYEAVVPFAFLASNPALKVSIRNIDDGLFKYFKTYQRYQQWDDNNSGNLFPSFQGQIERRDGRSTAAAVRRSLSPVCKLEARVAERWSGTSSATEAVRAGESTGRPPLPSGPSARDQRRSPLPPQ